MNETVIVSLIAASLLAIGIGAWHDNEIIVSYVSFVLGLITIMIITLKDKNQPNAKK